MKTKAQLIFEAMRRKEIDQDQANKLCALHIADTLEDHKPVPYVPRSESIDRYVRNRMQGIEQVEAALALRNAEWLKAVVGAHQLNYKNYDLLMWAGRLCRDIGASDAAAKIRGATMKVIHMYDRYPNDQVQESLNVQKKDSDDLRMPSQSMRPNTRGLVKL